MFKDISTDKQEIYKITNSGDYVFYFENKIGNLTFDIECENVNLKIYGLYKKSSKLNLIQNHQAPNSTSTSIIKSVLDKEKILDITSTIIIEKESNNTNANFINKNLLLSNKARTLITPQLKVIPRDVKCTHATTTSPLEESQLNYLISRGIQSNNAKKLLIDGFINEIMIARNKFI